MTIAQVEMQNPVGVWQRWGSRTGLSREEFDAYFNGAGTATALSVAAVERFPEPIPLGELRIRWAEFLPPQSYRFVDSGELGAILNGESSLLDRMTTPIRGGRPPVPSE